MPLTTEMINLSIDSTGRRHFLCLFSAYEAIQQSLNVSLGYPKGEGSPATTTDAIPSLGAIETHLGTMAKLSVESWRITPQIEAWLAPYLSSADIIETTNAWILP